jgi:hypothetical protein
MLAEWITLTSQEFIDLVEQSENENNIVKYLELHRILIK